MVEAGGVGLYRLIGSIQLAENISQQKRRNRTISRSDVHGMYTDLASIDVLVRMTRSRAPKNKSGTYNQFWLALRKVRKALSEIRVER